MNKLDTKRQDRNKKNRDKRCKRYGSQKHIRQQLKLREDRTSNITSKNKKKPRKEMESVR